MSKDNFYISHRNKRGVLIILSIALLIVFTPRVLLYIQPVEKYTISTESIDTLKRQIDRDVNHAYRKKSRFNRKMRYNRPTAKFDPNTYTLEDWMQLGLSEKQAKVILKFSVYGIRSNNDLKKIVVIPDELFFLIKDSTVYNEKDFSNAKRKEVTFTPKKAMVIDLNRATLEELDALKGIGPFYAKNIINYRDKLGGFYSIDQLQEVWKMTDDVFKKLEPFVELQTIHLRKIQLNNTTIEELKNHPYFTWNMANSVIKLRGRKGGFERIEDIKESALITDEIFEKIKPYVSL